MPAPRGKRPEQVAEMVRQVVGEALLREVRDPRLGLVTVTRAEVSGDLAQARVFVAVHGSDDDGQRALEGLESAAGFLRSRVAKALASRTTPELLFELDRGLLHAARINQVLERLKREQTP